MTDKLDALFRVETPPAPAVSEILARLPERRPGPLAVLREVLGFSWIHASALAASLAIGIAIGTSSLQGSGVGTALLDLADGSDLAVLDD